jgi:protein-L-isoaspartate(D-aspartate) O-methyltransferase
MVENLQSYGIIKSRKVAEVIENIDRGLFVPNGVQPYIDSPMAIGYNVTISAPHMHATCLQLLENYLQPGMHALDVGSGILHHTYHKIMCTCFVVFFVVNESYEH